MRGTVLTTRAPLTKGFALSTGQLDEQYYLNDYLVL